MAQVNKHFLRSDTHFDFGELPVHVRHSASLALELPRNYSHPFADKLMDSNTIHVALLVEGEGALWARTDEWFVVCVGALMGEDFIEASEYFHACVLILLSLFRLRSWLEELVQ